VREIPSYVAPSDLDVEARMDVRIGTAVPGRHHHDIARPESDGPARRSRTAVIGNVGPQAVTQMREILPDLLDL
jgi:hypothetical protein